MIYSFLYVLVFSFAAVLIQKLDISISPLFSLLITAAITAVYFNIINAKHLKHLYIECWREKGLCFGIMLIILIMWLCTMVAPGIIGASLYLFVYFAWLGALGFFSLSVQNWQKNSSKFYFGLIILVLIGIVSVDELWRNVSLMHVLGLALALLGGLTSFIYFKQSQAFIKRTKLSSTQILAFRFHLSILFLLVIIPKNEFHLYFTLSDTLQLILLAAVSLIVPLYFLQKALEKISSEHNAIILSLTPVCSAFLQDLVFKNVELKFIVIYFLYSIIIAISYLIGRKR